MDLAEENGHVDMVRELRTHSNKTLDHHQHNKSFHGVITWFVSGTQRVYLVARG